MQYPKDLTELISFRLSPALREQAEQAAEFHGISFSAYVRQSLTRNIRVSQGVEEEVVRRTTRLSLGHTD